MSRNLKNQNDLSIFGKIPPQSREMEEAVLGVIMLEKNSFDIVNDYLNPESFYVDSHQRIFKAMMALKNKSRPIDILTVVEELKLADEIDIVGGPYFITKLTNNVSSSAHIRAHCKTIQEKFIKRELIRLCGETIQKSYSESEDVDEIKSFHEKKYTEITSVTDDRLSDITSLLIENIKKIEYLRTQDKYITGVPSGFNDLDKITHGWQNDDLIILAARPSVGKTAFALNIAINGARFGKRIGFFSLEMSKEQLVNRMIANESGIGLEDILTGNIDDDKYLKIFSGVRILSETNIYFDDTPALTISHLTSKVRKLKRLGVEMIIIDYLQLMSGDRGKNSNRENEISNISRSLKGLAKELKIPIIALSQLSRKVEDRSEKTPQLSDLRESGAIEQDADIVMFLYRPEYYGKTVNENGENINGYTELSILKNRSGRLASHDNTLKFRANLSIQKFYEWDGSLNRDIIPMAGSWVPISKKEELNF